MATFQAVSGKHAHLFFGTFEVGFRKATIKENVVEGDTTNSTGGGATDQEVGPTGLEVAVEADADGNNNPWDLGYTAGANIANVTCYLNGSASPLFTIVLATLLQPQTEIGIKDPVVIGRNFTLKSKGNNFTLPTGGFATTQGT